MYAIRSYYEYSDAINFEVPEEKRYDEGKGMAVFNSAGYLEIAIYKSDNASVGSASSLMGLKISNTVRNNFV